MDRGEGLNYGRIKLPPFDDDDDTDLGLKELPIGYGSGILCWASRGFYSFYGRTPEFLMADITN